MMKKIVMFLLSMSMTLGVFAVPTVSDVRVKSQNKLFPWRNDFDIWFTVSGIKTDSPYILKVKAKNLDTGTETMLNSFNMRIPSNGVYHAVWNAKADLGSVPVKRMKLALDVVEGIIIDNHKGIRLWQGGPYWAETNIGAEKPEDAGYYFWWGDTKGYKRVGNQWVASDGSVSGYEFDSRNTPTYGKDNKYLQDNYWIGRSSYNLLPYHDPARGHWGKNWQMPIESEINKLVSWTTTEWTTINGVPGRLVKGKNDYSSASIFLPAAGYGSGGELSRSGYGGNYWSSTPGSIYSDISGSAWIIDFGSSDFHRYFNFRYEGLPVRPIFKFDK